MKPRQTRTRQRTPAPAIVPPAPRPRPPTDLDRLTPIERYIEESRRKELERPYDDPLPF